MTNAFDLLIACVWSVALTASAYLATQGGWHYRRTVNVFKREEYPTANSVEASSDDDDDPADFWKRRN